jgi:hypothetical protein
VAAYVMNALPPDEAFLVREHIKDCLDCQLEHLQLREVTTELGKVPAEAFIDGSPENAEFLIRGTLRRIRADEAGRAAARSAPATTRRVAGARSTRSSRSAGRPRSRDLAVAAAAVVLAVAAGAAIGRSSAGSNSSENVAIATPPLSAGANAVPGTVQGTATDPKTGASLTARIVPAQGWVRVTAATAGIKAGQRCKLYVVSRSGERVLAGSWLVSEKATEQGMTLQGSALTPPADVVAVEVENDSGDVLVRAEV